MNENKTLKFDGGICRVNLNNRKYQLIKKAEQDGKLNATKLFRAC